MCLIVYLSVESALPEVPTLVPEKFGLNPEPAQRPMALADREVVYEVCEWGGSGWWCACDLHFHHLPWVPELVEPEVTAAYGLLRTVISGALEANLQPRVFSCWVGDEQRDPEVTWIVAAEHMVPENNLFEEYEKTGGSSPPPSLFMFDERLNAPEATYHAAV